MKKLLFSLSFLIIYLLNYGQINDKYYENHIELGGDVTIKKSYIKIDGGYAFRIFEIEAPDEGEYYLNSWMMVPRTKEGYKEFSVIINGEKQIKSIKPEKDGWQSIKIKNNLKDPEKIRLVKGLNTVTFGTMLPDIPEVEFVRLSKDINKAEISSEQYDAYISKIKAHEEATKDNFIKRDSTESRLKSYTLDSPEANYYHVMDLNYNYTYNTAFYFTAGQRVNFSTGVSIPSPLYDPVIEFFNQDDPENRDSWVAYNKTLYATIRYSGIYRLRLRAYR